jgi:hypothetical protein
MGFFIILARFCRNFNQKAERKTEQGREHSAAGGGQGTEPNRQALPDFPKTGAAEGGVCIKSEKLPGEVLQFSSSGVKLYICVENI